MRQKYAWNSSKIYEFLFSLGGGNFKLKMVVGSAYVSLQRSGTRSYVELLFTFLFCEMVQHPISKTSLFSKLPPPPKKKTVTAFQFVLLQNYDTFKQLFYLF
jgi:hypothetical protein